MIRKLLIEGIVPKGSTTLVGNYFDKRTRTNLYLVDNGKRVLTEQEYDGQMIFNIVVEDGMIYSHEYEDQDPEEMLTVDFFKYHPLCRVIGGTNPNLAKAVFNIKIHHEVVEKDITKLDKNLKIAIAVLKLSFYEKYDLAFALGLDPRGKTHKDLVLLLVGPNLSGKAITDSETFEFYYKGVEADRKARVYANKAIMSGIIPMEGNYYKVGGRVLGASVKDVVDMCIVDKEFFHSYIVPEVDKLNAKPERRADDYQPDTELLSEELPEVKGVTDVEKIQSIKGKGRGKKDELLSVAIED
jgi:hypothetical protein